MPLHQRIIWARKRKGISQERLAAEVGTSRRHMIRIEKGLHRPGPTFRGRIADATGLQPEFFTDEDDEEEGDPMADLFNALRRVVQSELSKERVPQ